MNNMKRFLLFLLIGILLFTVSSCGKDNYHFISLKYDFYLNTTSYVYLEYNSKDTKKEDIIKDVDNDIKNILIRMENQFSPSKDSTLKNLNQNKELICDDEFIDVLNKSIEISNNYSVFDVSIGALTNIWNISNQAEYCYINDSCVKPSDDDIKEAIKAVDFNKIIIDGNKVTIPSNMLLDFGAIIKGYAANLIKEYLMNKGYDFFIINLGGNIYLNGTYHVQDGNEVNISLEDPYNLDNNLGTITVNNTSIVTSNIVKRYIEIDNIKYHHIIDKYTGYPVDNDLIQTTIINPDSMLADIYSTTTLILGLDGAVNLMSERNLDGILITKDKTIYIIINNDEYDDNIFHKYTNLDEYKTIIKRK